MSRFIGQLQKDMNDVTNSISSLVFTRHIYQRYTDIVRANPAVDVSNEFHDVFKLNYISAAVIGVGREIDMDKGSVSLARILQKIAEHPGEITKEWFVGCYNKFPRVGTRHFEEMFGGGDSVDPFIVTEDLGLLCHETKKLKKFRNKQIAHFDRNVRSFRFDIDFAYLNNAVSLLEKLAIKYDLLLHQTGWGDNTLLPGNADDWQEIFTIPWIRTS